MPTASNSNRPSRSWLRRLLAICCCRRSTIPDHERRITKLRQRGVRIGNNCLILTDQFSTEPYLIELGDDVGVAGGTTFVTHEAVVRMRRKIRPSIQHFGKITVGSNTQIGQNCIILAGTTIGRDCIIGAGSVVRGNIPDNSVVAGNPAKIIGRASLVLQMLLDSPDTFDAYHLSYEQRGYCCENISTSPPIPPQQEPFCD